MVTTLHRARQRTRQLFKTLQSFPWRNTLRTLQTRFSQDQLGLTASSLTFTTLLALVPFFTVLLSVFTAFPSFGRLQETLQRWLVDSLIPGEIAVQVMNYLVQFSSKASQLGVVGLAFLLLTVVSLILTMDKTLNHIWRVQRMRPLGQRLLIYWGVITFGPLLMGLSIATTSYVLSASRGLVAVLPESVQLGFNSLEFMLLSAAMAALYHFVPNTPVQWRHAWAGGLFVAAGMALAKKVLGLYLSTVPTYSVIYGTFATLPILLIWIYTCWVIFLLGAVVAAYLPSLLAGSSRSLHEPGWELELALEAIAVLEPLRSQDQRGLPAMALAKRLRVDRLQLEPALSALTSIRWVGAMPESGTAYLEEGEPRYVLLADPDQTLLAPLLQHMLIRHTEGTDALWRSAGWEHRLLRDALPGSHGACQDPVAQAGATSPAAVH
ncbi:YihY family inner membrane protein [Comamonas aquatica]|uniref:YihY family inner membrane protein n=1 Tax=Comamonas aquatica TaxID=225991 RepID=UPI0024484511|nr:YhjD/YihY/BrkB family envelope integrity protein [Comamonas aquatica]MDH0381182.1 YihY family inner membrane protein [Comamonas aquatica]MDH0428877.1 YihY family inner membrane protein [Comamonas aquatica]MDH0939385.1 YihY family inner membrane protein [Comamonas aquatica]